MDKRDFSFFDTDTLIFAGVLTWMIQKNRVTSFIALIILTTITTVLEFFAWNLDDFYYGRSFANLFVGGTLFAGFLFSYLTHDWKSLIRNYKIARMKYKDACARYPYS